VRSCLPDRNEISRPCESRFWGWSSSIRRGRYRSCPAAPIRTSTWSWTISADWGAPGAKPTCETADQGARLCQKSDRQIIEPEANLIAERPTRYRPRNLFRKSSENDGSETQQLRCLGSSKKSVPNILIFGTLQPPYQGQAAAGAGPNLAGEQTYEQTCYRCDHQDGTPGART
jgi:hypothetical protein